MRDDTTNEDIPVQEPEEFETDEPDFGQDENGVLPRRASRKHRRGTAGAVLLTIGALLIVAGVGVALWRFWPDISYEVGLIDTSYPYPTKLAPDEQPTDNEEIPEDARVVIPAIGADVAIFDDNQWTALKQGVYRHVETELPGEGGTTTIAGHREAGKFALLSRLQPGDYVIIYWFGTEYDYQVTDVWRTTPDDIEPLEDLGYERLVLYTCVSRTVGNYRTIVEAVPIETE